MEGHHKGTDKKGKILKRLDLKEKKKDNSLIKIAWKPPDTWNISSYLMRMCE